MKILSSFALIVVAACGSDPTAVTALTGDANRGAPLYAANCAACHGPTGAERSAAREAKSNLSGAASIVLDGEDEMPGFSGQLSSQDIADILAFLRSQ